MDTAQPSNGLVAQSTEEGVEDICDSVINGESGYSRMRIVSAQ